MGREGVIDVMAGSEIESGGAEQDLEVTESQDAGFEAPAGTAGLTGRVLTDLKAGVRDENQR